MYDSNMTDIIYDFKRSLQTASILITKLFHFPFFHLELLSQKKTFTSSTLILKAKANKEEILICLTDNIIKLSLAKEKYVFYIDDNLEEVTAMLHSLAIYQKNKWITEQIQRDARIIEIESERRKIRFQIPYDCEYGIHLDLWDKIEENITIMGLKQLYLHYFYPYQTQYERAATTKIIIYQKKDQELVITDEISIQDGMIQNYTLSTYKEGITISLSGAINDPYECKITGYSPNNDIDINAELAKLYEKSQNLDHKLRRIL